MQKIAATNVHLQPAGGADAGPESALACLEECMDALDREQRALLIEYYRGNGKTRIENRRRLAEQLGIELNALRNRAMRLRERVETCVRAKLEQKNK